MDRSRFALCLLLLFLLPHLGCKRSQSSSGQTEAPAASAGSFSAGVTSRKSHFAGEIARGKQFEIVVAPDMFFRLEPFAGNDSGWNIRIVPGSDANANSVDCIGTISEPQHGRASMSIEPPEDSTVAQSVSWKEREFEFVSNAMDCRAEWDLLNIARYPSKVSDRERE